MLLEPTPLDIEVIVQMAPLQRNAVFVDVVNVLISNSLVNGLVFAVPLFLLWYHAPSSERAARQRLMITVLLATLIGAFSSLILQQFFRWAPPAAAPETAHVFAPPFRENGNSNSFPSDSTMLYSTVAFGVASWSRVTGFTLFAWLLIVVAPARVFAGGHYPSDIAAGLLLGLLSFSVSRWITRESRLVEKLSASSSPIVLTMLFVWLFEVGQGFGDIRKIANAVAHIRRHF
jgi:undecaprenyl-diphosphatase